MKVFAAGVLLFLSCIAAQAAPQAIGDCEKIADPDGYNRCLASFGPAAKQGHFTDGPTVGNGAPVQERSVSRGGRGRGGYARRGRGSGYASRGGRVRMTIDVGASHRSPSRSRSRRR